jgi:hypothetical protein
MDGLKSDGAGHLAGGAAAASYLDTYLLWQGQADALLAKADSTGPSNAGGAGNTAGGVEGELAALVGELEEAVRGAAAHQVRGREQWESMGTVVSSNGRARV